MKKVALIVAIIIFTIGCGINNDVTAYRAEQSTTAQKI